MGLVIDFHLHIGYYHEVHPWVIEWMKNEIEDPEAFFKELLTPEVFVGYLRENGVDYGVALAEYSPITTGTLNNEAVAEFCKGIDCLIPFCNINPFSMVDHKLSSQLPGGFTAVSFRINHNQNHCHPMVIRILFQSIQVTNRWHIKECIYELDPIKSKVFFCNSGEIKIIPFPIPYFLHECPLRQRNIIMCHPGRCQGF